MENNMTAVEWLLEQTMYMRSTKWPDIVEQALEMEKQQIIDAYNNGDLRSAELYYNETYGKS